MGSDITDFKEAKPIKALRDPKKFLGKQVKNPFEIPGFPTQEFPEFPEFDAARDAAARSALISRIRQETIRGGGIKATIKTSPLGVTDRAPAKKRRGHKLPEGFELQKPPTVR